MKNRVIWIFTAIALFLSMLAGCGGKIDDSLYGGRPRKVTLAYQYGGYGHEYWEQLAIDFMENYDSEIYFEVKPFYDLGMDGRIRSGKAEGDIVAISIDMFGRSTFLERLDNVYDMNALGEDIAIKDKVGEYFYRYYQESNGWYQLPASNMWGFNWVYNKTVLDNTFGTDNYSLPRTTNKFFEFGDTLYDKGVFLTSAALGDTAGGEYLVYAFQCWFAQMMGFNTYNKFYDGFYYDNDTWRFSEEHPYVLSANRTAIESAYSLAYRLCSKDNNYFHPSSKSLDFKKNDQVFAGGGYGLNRAKTAFLYTGSWFENEISDLLEDGIIEPQVYGVIKSPVVSDIVKMLEYRNGANLMTDDMLSSLIEAIDNKATSFQGVSEKDFNRVKEARNMVLEQICAEFVVPKIKNESKREDIMKILTYLASERAQKVSSIHTGGVNMLPYGYLPNYEELNLTVSKFISDFNAIRSESVIIDHASVNKPFKRVTSLDWYRLKGGGILAQHVYSGTAYTPETIFDVTYTFYNGNLWNTLIRQYKEATGQI